MNWKFSFSITATGGMALVGAMGEMCRSSFNAKRVRDY